MIFDIRYPHPKCRACAEFLKDYGGKKDQAHGFGPLLSDVWNDIHPIMQKEIIKTLAGKEPTDYFNFNFKEGV